VGRPYQDELNELGSVPERLPAEALARLRDAIAAGLDAGIVVVASGGARVVADWFCQLHLAVSGRAAASLTPLQYASLPEPLEAATWFISASGSHADVMHACRAAIGAGSRRVAALVGRADSPLSQLLWKAGHTHAVSLNHLAGMDGFLATNSLWSMVLALAYAYRVDGLDSKDALAESSQSMLGWAARSAASLTMERANGSSVILHDAWTRLGALDFEIRSTEVSLHRVWRTDFRNFGHGRHYWLADRGSESEVIALMTLASHPLGDSTLAEFPPAVIAHKILVPFEGVLGSAASLAWSMFQVGISGLARGRDPGRPGVPKFGERLYEGQYSWPTLRLNRDSFSLALERKVGRAIARNLGDADRDRWQTAYSCFVRRLSAAVIRGVVFDFDGTLVDTDRRFDPIEPSIVQLLNDLLKANVLVGIATGRGDSAYRSLQAAIPQELREHVIVGYHNGAEVRSLNIAVDDLDGLPSLPDISSVAALLDSTTLLQGLARVRTRPAQCTVTPRTGVSLESLWSYCSELINTTCPGLGLNVQMSSHSIDITARFATKLRVVDALTKAIHCKPENILRVGDKGAWPGNDHELLRAPLGLSVYECSLHPDSCWNLASRSCSGPRAVIELLEDATANSPGNSLSLRISQ
jgi:haloacid dehalogenase-like hydrolase